MDKKDLHIADTYYEQSPETKGAYRRKEKALRIASNLQRMEEHAVPDITDDTKGIGSGKYRNIQNFTNEDKIRIVLEVLDNPDTKIQDIAAKHNLRPSTLRNWCYWHRRKLELAEWERKNKPQEPEVFLMDWYLCHNTIPIPIYNPETAFSMSPADIKRLECEKNAPVSSIFAPSQAPTRTKLANPVQQQPMMPDKFPVIGHDQPQQEQAFSPTTVTSPTTVDISPTTQAVTPKTQVVIPTTSKRTTTGTQFANNYNDELQSRAEQNLKATGAVHSKQLLKKIPIIYGNIIDSLELAISTLQDDLRTPDLTIKEKQTIVNMITKLSDEFHKLTQLPHGNVATVAKTSPTTVSSTTVRNTQKQVANIHLHHHGGTAAPIDKASQSPANIVAGLADWQRKLLGA